MIGEKIQFDRFELFDLLFVMFREDPRLMMQIWDSMLEIEENIRRER